MHKISTTLVFREKTWEKPSVATQESQGNVIPLRFAATLNERNMEKPVCEKISQLFLHKQVQKYAFRERVGCQQILQNLPQPRNCLSLK